VDEDVRELFSLDGIITLVDAKHVLLHLEVSNECREQIAFADVLVLNKTDLVSPAELDQLERRIRSMNALAKILRTTNAAAPMTDVLDVGGFDLERAMQHKNRPFCCLSIRSSGRARSMFRRAAMSSLCCQVRIHRST